MKNRLLIALSFSVILAACSKAKPDSKEDAFRQKFDVLRIGMVQDEVVGKLGEPTRTLYQTEEEDDTVPSPSGMIQIHKGDKVAVWNYVFGRRNYALWFTAQNTNADAKQVLFMQNVISAGDPVRVR